MNSEILEETGSVILSWSTVGGRDRSPSKDHPVLLLYRCRLKIDQGELRCSVLQRIVSNSLEKFPVFVKRVYKFFQY